MLVTCWSYGSLLWIWWIACLWRFVEGVVVGLWCCGWLWVWWLVVVVVARCSCRGLLWLWWLVVDVVGLLCLLRLVVVVVVG